METLQQSLAENEALLADPGIYAAERKAELTEALRRRGELQGDLAYTEKMWLEVGEELERIGTV